MFEIIIGVEQDYRMRGRRQQPRNEVYRRLDAAEYLIDIERNKNTDRAACNASQRACRCSP